MDWRKRNYYLVYTDPLAYQMRHRYYQLAAPSLKRHSPYCHFKEYIGTDNYDGYHKEITGHSVLQEMISCRIEDSKAFEYELAKAVRNDCGFYCKLTKEICGQ